MTSDGGVFSQPVENPALQGKEWVVNELRER